MRRESVSAMMKQKKNARPDRPTGAERRKRGRRMELRLDLHVHSAQSIDGQMSLGEIIDAARSRGLDGVAVCEHDRLFQPTRSWRFRRIFC